MPDGYNMNMAKPNDAFNLQCLNTGIELKCKRLGIPVEVFTDALLALRRSSELARLIRLDRVEWLNSRIVSISAKLGVPAEYFHDFESARAKVDELEEAHARLVSSI